MEFGLFRNITNTPHGRNRTGRERLEAVSLRAFAVRTSDAATRSPRPAPHVIQNVLRVFLLGRDRRVMIVFLSRFVIAVVLWRAYEAASGQFGPWRGRPTVEDVPVLVGI